MHTTVAVGFTREHFTAIDSMNAHICVQVINDQTLINQSLPIDVLLMYKVFKDPHFDIKSIHDGIISLGAENISECVKDLNLQFMDVTDDVKSYYIHLILLNQSDSSTNFSIMLEQENATIMYSNNGK